MILLTVNTGSSSVRIAAFRRSDRGLERIAGEHHKAGGEKPEQILKSFMDENNIEGPSCIAHRVVHGGTKFVGPSRIDSAAEKEIERLSDLAPLHNPPALNWIRACRNFFGGDILQIAVFDTAFYAGMPEKAYTYALPRNLCRRHEIRRYGFHGLAHSAMLQRWRELRPDPDKGGKVISLQLGAGCSITAVDRGTAVDTSMGFSPLEGLVMATRSGDLDPGLVTYLANNAGFTPFELEKLLNNASGILGISGLSNDMRVLLESDLPEARLAVDVYCYRAKKYIGAYLAVLGGADAVLFGGGVGEHAPLIREKILEDMQVFGISIDSRANNSLSGEGRISMPENTPEVWVIPVDEARILAEEAEGLVYS